MVRRKASHAGSWYTDNAPVLSQQLDGWIAEVPNSIDGVGTVPKPGARVIIAPHAGYAYSGPPAAWAYKSLDLSKAKRVFLLGPSHHFYLSGCALSQCTHYETPLGDITLDKATIAELQATSRFTTMSVDTDEAEHSLEMHLPYIYKMLSRNFSPNSLPPLVPILVGSTNPAVEKEYGELLAPYLADLSNVFVVSSDFCHWGLRFNYTYYVPSSDPSSGYSLGRKSTPSSSTPIHASIKTLDQLAMRAVESGNHDAFLENLSDTGNTVCGRHPIGVVMRAMEVLRAQRGDVEEEGIGKFKFVKYERSSNCTKVGDSSVSYASAFAVI